MQSEAQVPETTQAESKVKKLIKPYISPPAPKPTDEPIAGEPNMIVFNRETRTAVVYVPVRKAEDIMGDSADLTAEFYTYRGWIIAKKREV